MNPMKPILTPKEFRRAAYLTLGLSLPGLLAVCSLLLGPLEALKVLASYPVQIATGYLGMILVVRTVGVPFRYELCGYGAGAAFGIFLFLAGVLFGSASTMILHREFDPRWVIGALFWMGFYGVLPATAFGMTGTRMLRKIRQASPPDALHSQRP